MNIKSIAALGWCCGALGLTGCVSTVDGKHTGAVPFVSDKVVSRYPRPIAQVFPAAKDALAYYAVVTVENVVGKTLEGKADNRTVWIRCEAVDPATTEVTTQVRTKFGGGDPALAAQIDKQMAIFITAGRSVPPPPRK